jgi:hypothetical protein
MVFGHQVLAPGPGTRWEATFRWHPVESALSGSRFFKPPALPEVMTCGPLTLRTLRALREKIVFTFLFRISHFAFRILEYSLTVF